jgi:hypothetical protein
LDALNRRLNDLALAHKEDEEVWKFALLIQERLSDGRFVALSLDPQSEWLGGDSSDGNNFGLREPNAVSMAGHVPHLIKGSRGKSVPAS